MASGEDDVGTQQTVMMRDTADGDGGAPEDDMPEVVEVEVEVEDASSDLLRSRPKKAAK
jgi:hypothetical protein